MAYQFTVNLKTGDKAQDRTYAMVCPDKQCLLDCQEEFESFRTAMIAFGRSVLGATAPAGAKKCKEVAISAEIREDGRKFSEDRGLVYYDLPEAGLKAVQDNLHAALTKPHCNGAKSP